MIESEVFKHNQAENSQEFKEKETIVRVLTDTDLYKITMGQAVLNFYPRVGVEYELINRGQTQFPPEFAENLRKEVGQMSRLILSREEKDFLERKCGHYLKSTFLEWFSGYRFNPDEVTISQDDGDLKVLISGPWHRTIYWEVPLMATISELYFQMTGQKPQDGWLERAKEKGRLLKEAGVKFVDFGTRRRFSYAVHEKVTEALLESAGRETEDGVFKGTSNVYLAMKYNLTPIGTFAHEWVMAHAAMFGYKMATPLALESWIKEFNGQLGIALSDTFTTDEFLRHFNARFARLFDGIRQDSGDPLESLEKFIRHYQKLRIDPTTKTFVASDSLDVEKALRIQEQARGRIRTLFGIGTNLTNDVGVKPLNFVIKLFRVILEDGQVVPVIKLSDDYSKISGDQRATQAAFYELGISP